MPVPRDHDPAVDTNNVAFLAAVDADQRVSHAQQETFEFILIIHGRINVGFGTPNMSLVAMRLFDRATMPIPLHSSHSASVTV